MNTQLIPIIFQILLTITEILHYLIFIMFFVCVIRTFLVKYAPYSCTYLAIIIFIQSIFNGCPVSTLQNYLSLQAGQNAVPNLFWAGIFGEYETLFRIVLVFLAAPFVFRAILQWSKVEVKLDFGRIFTISNS